MTGLLTRLAFASQDACLVTPEFTDVVTIPNAVLVMREYVKDEVLKSLPEPLSDYDRGRIQGVKMVMERIDAFYKEALSISQENINVAGVVECGTTTPIQGKGVGSNPIPRPSFANGEKK